MPMRLSRAKKLEKLGKCKIKFDNKLCIYYIQLKYKPSGEERQPIILGIDPGSRWDGFSLLTLKEHLINFQLNHNKKIKKRMKDRSTYRRTRRSRLRNRSTRFDSRTAEKLVPTIRSMLEFRKWLELKLKYFYPISSVILEDLKFNHYKRPDGSTFSAGEIGKTAHEKFLRDNFPKVTIIDGFETCKARRLIFKGIDPKLKFSQKGSNSFYTHCVDSYTLTHRDIYSTKLPKLKTFGISFTKYWNNRRELHQVKAKLKNGKYHKKYSKSGKEKLYTPKGKSKVTYVQKFKNNFKEFDLLINGVKPTNLTHKRQLLAQKDLRYKQFKKNYGGTMVKHVSKSTVVLNKADNRIEWLDTSTKIKEALKDIKNYKFLGYSNQTTKTFN